MNRTKDRHLNRNIRKFLADYSANASITRETELKPEILIPCYNQGRYLSRTLESVRADIPVTVINDASTDDTAEILVDLKTKYPFKLITNSINLNQSGSLNKAIVESDNNLFIILNADDYLCAYSPDTILALFNRYPNIFLVGGGSIHFDDDGVLESERQSPITLDYLPTPQIYTPADAYNYKSVFDIHMDMSGCSFSKAAWQAVGGFREFKTRVCSYDDRDFQIRVSALFDVAVVAIPLCFYRTNSSLGLGQHTYT